MKAVSNVLQISHLHFEHLAYFRWWLLLLSWPVAKAGFQLSSSSGIAFTPLDFVAKRRSTSSGSPSPPWTS